MTATQEVEVNAPASTQPRTDWIFWLAVLVCTLILAAAVNSESLWIDEGYSAWVACHRSLPQMLDSLQIGDSSDLEMLLYNVYLWTWVHLFGPSEYAMRSANFPFIVLLVAAFAITSRLAFQRRFAWIAAACAPFLFVYANEARAYFPMMACAAASTGGLLVYTYGPPERRRQAAWVCLVFLAAAMLFHMLSGFLLPAYAVILLAEARRDWRRWIHDWWQPLACLSPVFLLAAAYYGWTLSRGEAYIYGAPNIRHLLSVLYDFAGLEGLGPNRNVLREQVDSHTLRPFVFTLIAGIAALLATFFSRWNRPSKVLLTAWAIGLTTAILAGSVMNSLFLARHVAALAPIFLLTLIAHTGRTRLFLLTAVWLLSDARIALLSEYQKDDYRGAVEYAITHNSGMKAVWNADQLAAAYYGLRTANPYHLPYFEFDYVAGLNRVDWPVRATAITAANWNPTQVAGLLADARRDHQPVLLVMGKPNLYDVHGGWSPLLKDTKPIAIFQSFRIYRLP